MSTSPKFPLPEEVLAALRSGNKIEAIKLLRQVAGGLGLKEAKDLLDQISRASGKPQTPASRPSSNNGRAQSSASPASSAGSRSQAAVDKFAAIVAKTRDGGSRTAPGRSPGEVPDHAFPSWLLVLIAIAALVGFFYFGKG